MTDIEIPKPSDKQVEKYLKKWNYDEEIEKYREQEKSLNFLFHHEEYSKNKQMEVVLAKVSILNDFYSTNIFSTYPVAKTILNIENFDERLKNGDMKLIDEIRKVKINGKEKNFYSFATKYCSHHNTEVFPIYDSYVEKMLCYFKKRDNFFSFKKIDLKNYTYFKNTINAFIKKYDIKHSIKEVDKYLWLCGKEYFNKKY